MQIFSRCLYPRCISEDEKDTAEGYQQKHRQERCQVPAGLSNCFEAINAAIFESATQRKWLPPLQSSMLNSSPDVSEALSRWFPINGLHLLAALDSLGVDLHDACT